MRRNNVTSAAAFALLACLVSCTPDKDLAKADLLITGGRLLNFEDTSHFELSDILIDDGVITKIAPHGDISHRSAENAIDARGLYLMPGVIDVHAHLGHGGLAENTDADRKEALAQFVRYGVTSIFVPGGGGGNDKQLQAWKKYCKVENKICPRVFGSGNLITAYGSHPITTGWGLPADVDPEIIYERGAFAMNESDSAALVIEQKVEAGVDAIKIVIEDGPGPFAPKPKMSRTLASRIVTEAHKRNLSVYAHVSLPSHIDDAVAAGVDGVMHSVEEPLSEETIAAMRSAQMFFVPTLALYDGFRDQALGNREQEPYAISGVSKKALRSFDAEEYWLRLQGSQDEEAEFFATLEDNLVRVDAAGIPVALGTDTNNPQVFPGYSAHEELSLMVEAGLTPSSALSAATLGGAAFLGREKELGRIAVGYRADIIGLRGNPLENIENTRELAFVVQDGRSYDGIVSRN